MLDERLAVAEADGQRAQMHVVEHLLGFLEAAHLERDNAAEPRHLADGHGVIGMVLQTGIEHFLHILGAGKEVHHFQRVCAYGVYAHLERLETAQDQKRLLRSEHCARNVLESDHADLVHDLLARRREARDHVAVAVEILGRAVHDDIRAQLQRLHQHAAGDAGGDTAICRAGRRARAAAAGCAPALSADTQALRQHLAARSICCA